MVVALVRRHFSLMSDSSLQRLEKLTAIALSGVIVILLVVRAGHAGALWRDESGLVQLSLMPTISDILTNFPHEAFPPFFPAIIRGWTYLFGTADVAFRAFGVLVGILLIAVMWFNARLFPGGVPLLSLALLGLNSTFLMWGSSIRGYGLATVAISLAFGSFARLIVRPSPLLMTCATLAAVASVQCLLHNTVLLFVIIVAAMTVLLVDGRFRSALGMFGIGIVALISFLPYVHAYAEARALWDVTVRTPPVAKAWLWQQLDSAFGTPMPAMAVVWATCFILVIGSGIWRLFVLRHDRSSREWNVLLFAVIGSIGSIITYFGFLHLVHYFPQPWYYFTTLGIAGVALELVTLALAQNRLVRIGRVVFPAILLICLPFAAWPKITQRQTNIDMVADTLGKKAAANDLIVIAPWQYGIPFNRYYHGSARWLTLPDLEEHRFHRYDLIKEKMELADPNADVLSVIRDTLRGGNQVWFVGDIQVPKKDATPLTLTPAPDPKYGWDGPAYCQSWSQHLGIFLRTHIGMAHVVSTTNKVTISDMENAPLVVTRGWRE
ncbi:MAG: hypothetical protein ACJ8M1_05605 [Chthoniobacterales bacterium]